MVAFHTVPYGLVTRQRRRSADDWLEIALDALAKGGAAAVNMERLAASVGATKGSVYWHFPNREALLAATLDRWERESTDAVIEFVERQPTPGDKLRTLFSKVLDDDDPHPELALLASSGDEMVDAAVRRVSQRRISCLEKLFRDLGFTRAQAARRAVLAYSVYLGKAQLRRGSPDVLPATRSARRAHLEDALRTLTTPPED